MRKLAHIEKIEWKQPIEGADKIELVGVLGWSVIAKKDEFCVGDLCVYIEIDSIVDSTNPVFAFLESKHYKIKTMKMRGVISQGIVFPLDAFGFDRAAAEIGADVTKELKIQKIEDEPPRRVTTDRTGDLKHKHPKLMQRRWFKWLMKYQWFRKLAFSLLIPKKVDKAWPSWIRKTDEERIQSCPAILTQYAGKSMVVTEKLDGTSTSFGLRKAGLGKLDFAICSRNVRMKSPTQKCFYDDNVYCEMAAKYNIRSVLEAIMKERAASVVVLQGETIGEGIQANKYALSGHDFYGFNLVIDGVRIDSVEAAKIAEKHGVKWVPILDEDFRLLPTVEEMLAYADATSVMHDTLREGVVIRDHSNTVSFKCISNSFLLKHGL